jgi:glycosyltransferase involved in cell wall biosynthesis
MREELEARVADAGLGANICFLGECSDVPSLLAQADILVRPSLLEGLPLAVLEGMAAGLPVVASRVGGTPELVRDGETGFLVEPGDPADLAGRICSLLGDTAQRTAMGRRAREVVEQGYDWDDVARRTIKVYEQAANVRSLVHA